MLHQRSLSRFTLVNSQQYKYNESTKPFPLAPERKIVDFELYSKEQQEQIKNGNIKLSELLICDLTDKNNYVIHYRIHYNFI